MRNASFISRSFLKQRWLLWAFFWSNLLGTIYGYYWYKDQLIDTWATESHWLITFVPDSPTASLFFTIAVLFLLYPPKRDWGLIATIRVIIEALAVITSIKYGIWACAMIIAGASLGSSLVWQDWMLMASHSAMAIEVLLFMRLFRCGAISLLIAAVYTWINDLLDYTFGIYPRLSYTLKPYLTEVAWFTIILTGVSLLFAILAWRQRVRQDRRDYRL